MAELRAKMMVKEEALGLGTKKLHRRISWEEFNERWFKGLCMFCNELETPDHHLLHKKSGLLMVECEDLVEREVEVENDAETKSMDKMASQLQLQEELQSPDIFLEEKKSIPQFQVPIANSESLRKIEPVKVKLGLENQEHVVMNENLEQEWVHKTFDSFDVEGDVDKGQKMLSIEKFFCAHKVFAKMSPHKETLGIKKKQKGFKSRRFKFKHRVAPRDSKSSIEVKMKQKTSKEYPYKMLLEGRFEVPTSTDLLLSKERDSPPEVAIGCELEAGERDTWIDQNQLIQEEAKNHSTDSFHETSLLHHMTSLLKHQVSISHWEFRHRSPIECLDVYEELPSASIGCQVLASLPLKTKLLRNRRMTTFSKNWCFKFKELDVRQEDVQNAFIHMSAIETRYATTFKDVRLMRQTHKSRMWFEVWLIQTLQDLQQFTLGEVRFQIKHKWRFKLLHLVPELKFSLESVACVSLSDDQCDHCVVVRTCCVWTTQMQFGSESNHVWHRWKARCFFVGVISTMRAWLFGEEGFDIGNEEYVEVMS